MLKLTFFVEKYFWELFIKSKCMWLRTGPGDLKNNKHLKFDKRQIFKAFFKKCKKSHFPIILKIVSSTR